MSINVGFYGTERTYYGSTVPQYAVAKSHIDTTDGEGVNGTLSVFTRKNLMSLNELPDLSCCYTGIGDSNSGWTDYAYLNLFTGTPAATVSTGNVPFFIADIGTVKPNAYWQAAVPILTNPTSEDADTSWGMGSTKTDVVYVEAGWVMDNTDSTVAPIVEVGGRAIRWLIIVAASAVDENGLPTGTPHRYTLDQYYAGAYEDYPAVLKVALVPHGRNSGGYWDALSAVGTWSGRRPYTLAPVTTDIFTANGKRYLKLTRNVDSQNWPSVYYTDEDSLTFEYFPALVMGFSAELVSQQSYYSKSSTTGVIRPVYSYSKMTVTVQNDHIYCYHMVNDINEFRDLCRRSAAYTGQFFTGSYSTAISRSDSIWEDPSMLLGTIEDNGLTYGKYTMGADNATQPQFSAEDMVASTKYDPEKPTPPTPISPDTSINPIDPKISIAGKGSKLFILRPGDIEDILDSMYGVNEDDWDALIKGLALQGSDPLGAIISYRAYMWPYTSTVSSPIYLGRTQITDEYYPVLNNNLYKQTAYFQLADDEDFITSRHLMARLFLPLYGWYQLPTDRIISQQLKVDLRYKAPDDLGCYIISFGDVVYDIVDFQPFIDIPISGRAGGYKEIGKTFNSVFSTLGSGLGSIIQGRLSPSAASLAAGAQTMGNILMTTLTAGPVAKKQSDYSVPFRNGSSSTMLYLPMYPFIQFYKQKTIKEYNDPGYIKSTGIACDVWRTLGNMPENSLLQINNPVLNDYSNMKTEEINELNSILSSGFYR